jgi:hypothetical protein
MGYRCAMSTANRGALGIVRWACCSQTRSGALQPQNRAAPISLNLPKCLDRSSVGPLQAEQCPNSWAGKPIFWDMKLQVDSFAAGCKVFVISLPER